MKTLQYEITKVTLKEDITDSQITDITDFFNQKRFHEGGIVTLTETKLFIHLFASFAEQTFFKNIKYYEHLSPLFHIK